MISQITSDGFFFAYKCYFWIGGHAGLENIAITFRKPFLDLNMVPLLGLKITSKKTILCLKIHKNHNNKKQQCSLPIYQFVDQWYQQFSQ